MTKIQHFHQSKFLSFNGILHDFKVPHIMGIINLTPDSFYPKSRKQDKNAILKEVATMIEQGANIIDIGGVSTRPGAIPPTKDEEIERILNPLIAIRKEFPKVIVSLDTFRSEIVELGIENGVNIINDVSSFSIDPKIIEIVAKNKTPYILTHSNGQEINELKEKSKDSIMTRLLHFFSEKIAFLHENGVKDIIIDPGFGFSKTSDENFEIIRNFEMLQLLEKPILIGVSRKSMIYQKLDIEINKALNGTTVLNTILYSKNPSVFRVHDVKEMKEVSILMNSCI
jgi:dihydropteroate synthase